MKNKIAAVILTISASQAFAFNWESVAKKIQLGDRTVKVSTILFKERFFAQEFCKSVKMTLASQETIEATANVSEGLRKQVILRADIDETPAIETIGIWGWTNDPIVKTGDATVFLKYADGSGLDTYQFLGLNNWLVKKGLMPYKGLPAICE